MENEHMIKVGVGVMIFKDGKILLARRRGSHGAGEYAFPGGHLEYMESFELCAERETREECGIEIHHVRFQLLENVTAYAPKHYVHVGMIADWKSGIPKILEPERSEEWRWYGLDELPEPMFLMCKRSVDSYQTNTQYYRS